MHAETNACVLRARLLERAMTIECALRALRLAPDSCRCAVREAAAAGILRNGSACAFAAATVVVKPRCCDMRVQLVVRLCERKVTLRESAAWTHLDRRTVKRGQRLAREAQLQQKCQLARWRWRGCAAAVLRTHTCRSKADVAVRLVRWRGCAAKPASAVMLRECFAAQRGRERGVPGVSLGNRLER